jgi:hypothetical protein
VWAGGLRGETVEALPDEGLIELCFGNNKLGDRGAVIVARTLYHDVWLRAVDLRRNRITEEGLAEIIPLVNGHKSVTLFDVRENSEPNGVNVMRDMHPAFARNIARWRKQSEKLRF